MQVRVQNLNIHPYTERFRDMDIKIPAGGEILMDEDDADNFLATYCYPKKDAQGRPDPLFFKKLRIHPEDAQTRRDKANNPHVCHANGQKVGSAAELTEVLKNFSHMLASPDDGAEAEAIRAQNGQLKRENKQLKSRLDLIEERLGLKESAHGGEDLPPAA